MPAQIRPGEKARAGRPSAHAAVGLLALGLLIALLPTWHASQAAARPPDSTIVRVTEGALRGRIDGTVTRYQGVPYAAAPVGDRRWTPPAPHPHWNGVRDATQPQSRCPQRSWGDGAAGSEDCLYLNVTRPTDPSRPGLMPVIVWLHGGGLDSGSGADYNPTDLATTGDLVVVTINYRLGALGFLSHPALDQQESPVEGPATSGNYGLLDQAAALRWVRRNAVRFGGHPHRITVGGDSGGGRSVCAHLAAPNSRGTFRQAIVQSGACANKISTKTAADRKGARVVHEVGCDHQDDVAACLRDVPAARLTETLDGVGTKITDRVADAAWGPVAGTSFLPVQPATAIKHGSAARIPLLIGSTHDEMRAFVPGRFDLHPDNGPLTAAGYAEQVEKAFGDDAPAILQRYPAENYQRPVLALSAVLTDWGRRIGSCPTLTTMRQASRHAPVFGYELTEESGYLIHGVDFGAFHGWDLPFLFDVPWQQRYPVPDQQLSESMINYWASFARHGDPRTAGLPSWRPYNADAEVLALSGDGIAPTPFAGEHQCRFWAGIDRADQET